MKMSLKLIQDMTHKWSQFIQIPKFLKVAQRLKFSRYHQFKTFYKIVIPKNSDAIVPPGQDVMQDKMDPIELIEEPTPTDFYQPEKKDPDTPYIVYRL